MPSTLCVLLWAHPDAGAALAAYEDTVLRLVPDHGGRVVLRARGSGALRAGGSGALRAGGSGALRAGGGGALRAGGSGTEGQPAEVQVIEFPSATALDAYMADPRRTALAADRDRAVARTEIIDVELVPPLV